MPDAATWAVIIGPITTLLSGLGGYWLAGRNEEARDQRAAAREAAGRRAALAERLEEDRHTFQRDTLLELQDELQRLARITTRINLQDEKTLKERGQLYQLPEGLSDEAHQIVISLQRLRARALDPELRQAVADFVALCSRDAVGLAHLDKDSALAELRRQYAELAPIYAALSDRLGEHLRRELDRRILAIEPRDGAPPPTQ
jgi:hypothetical protein